MESGTLFVVSVATVYAPVASSVSVSVVASVCWYPFGPRTSTLMPLFVAPLIVTARLPVAGGPTEDVPHPTGLTRPATMNATAPAPQMARL